jgi:hypothetical protein
MKKILIILLSFTILFSSCAHSKYMVIEEEITLVKPYGWVNKKAQKRDDVKYELSAGTIAFSLIFFNTLFIPVWLTGWKLYTPVDPIKVEKK